MEIALSSKTETKQNKKTKTTIIKSRARNDSNLKDSIVAFWCQGVGLWVNNKVFSIDFMESILMF